MWQSAEQCCREADVADAASVARQVRGCSSCHDPRTTPSLCLAVVMCMVWCGNGVIRWLLVLESCELPRCVSPVAAVVVEPAVAAFPRVLSSRLCCCVAHNWKRRYSSSGVCDVACVEE